MTIMTTTEEGFPRGKTAIPATTTTKRVTSDLFSSIPAKKVIINKGRVKLEFEY
jgi:hypothetical protein